MIEEYIRDLLPPGIPCVIGTLPGTNKNIASLWVYDSGVNTEYFGGNTLCQPVLKIAVRHEDFRKASEWLESVRDTLNRYHDNVLSSVLVSGHYTYLGRGESKLHEFQIIFNITIRSDE